MPGVFQIAGLLGIEFRFCTANFADEDMEVSRLFLVPDEGEHRFLNWHHNLLCAEHTRRLNLAKNFLRIPYSFLISRARISGVPHFLIIAASGCPRSRF